MRPLVIGHAAAAGEAPANTLAGVRRALAAPAEAMEIDVQVTADGVPILLHDLTLDRTTSLKGPVREHTLARLAGADAGDGEPIPTLDNVLALVAGRLTVMCELKTDPRLPAPEAALADAVLEVVRRHGAEPWTAVHSFDASIVGYARTQEPRVSAAIISPAMDEAEFLRLLGGLLKRNGQAVSLEHGCITAALVTRARQSQVTTWAWTADEKRDWERLVKAGVDGIITNYPARLRAFLESR